MSITRTHLLHWSIFTLGFLFLANPAQAQLTGTVLDEQGEPLPYASVYVRNSTQGTAANGDGEFKLPLERGTHEIVFQYIGYRQHIETVTIADKPVRIKVRLEPSDLELSEVVITTEDPAMGIMRQVIAKREFYRTRTPAFSCDAYIKGFYKLADAPKKIFGQDIGDMDGMLDSTRSGIIYLSESVSKLYSQAKPQRHKEVMISSKVSGSPNGYSFNRATMTEFSLYNERINIERDILSPLADNAFSYYRFRLMGRYKDENGYDIYKIEVTPKNNESPTFQGFLYVVDEWWNLAGVDIVLTGKAIQQPILDTLVIQQTYVPVQKPDEWCPISQVMGFKFKVLGFKVNGFFNGVFSNYNVRPGFDAEFFDRETFKVDQEATKRDTTYWSRIRPIPLTREESLDYVRKDSIYYVHESRPYRDSMDRVYNRFRVSNIWSGYTWRNSFKHTSIGYPSLTQGWQFNAVQGWLINFDPQYSHSDGPEESRYIRVKGILNYGFSEKHLRGGLRIERQFESIHYTKATLEGGIQTAQFDSRGQINEFVNLLFSLLDKRNYLRIYEKTFVRGEFARHVGNGLDFSAGAEYARRKPLVNHSNFSIYKKQQDYLYNSPLPADMAQPEVPFFETHEAFILHAKLRIRFGETYSTYPNFRHIQRSDKPEITLQYRKAVRGLAGSDVDYDFISLDIAQDNLGMGLFGYSEWNLGGGVFWRKKQVEFPDFYHPKSNLTFVGQPDQYARGFFLLPYYEFSTDDAYAEAHLRHHFNGWLLDRIPLIRKLNWKEALGAGVYYADQFAADQTRTGTTLPYWELSFGFYNIGIKFLRPLHIDVAVGFMGNQHHRTGVVIGVNL